MKENIRKEKGFTLIELLVVIGILGVLASALVATIDPFEQLKKAQDSNVKNTAVEFMNAAIRYYTTHNAFPWDSFSLGGTDCMNGVSDLTASTLGTMTSCLQALVNDGELKTGFTTATNSLSKILVNETSNNITTCFLPQSKSQQRDPNTKYASNGVVTTGCKSQGGSADCYWCAL
jgi:prepilin-type N-terminal cleavage/methylation domain-containing protein